MDFKPYEDFAVATARETGKLLLRHFQGDFEIEYKGNSKNNLVTEIDKLSENFIIRSIQTSFPDHNILSEESGEITSEKSDFTWIIDPIDGTNNFAHGHPFFCISIGLAHQGEIVAGVVYAPYYGELFRAAKGHGAFLNDTPIHVSNVEKVEVAMLATGFPYENKSRNFPHFEYFTQKAQGVRRMGAAALELAYLAAGRQDGFWEFGLKNWDFAAGKILIEEAGGKVTNIMGKSIQLSDTDILASNGKIHEEMLEKLEEGRPEPS